MTTGNNKGLTLIEMSIAMAIMSFALTIIFIPQIEIQKVIVNSEKKMSRIIQMNELKQKLLETRNSLTVSAMKSPENDTLCPCTEGGAFLVNSIPKCAVNECQAGQEVDFSFYDPKNPDIKMAGTSSVPVYYFAGGTPCPGVQADPLNPVNPEEFCDYKTITKYKAHCPGDLGTCDHADYIIVVLEFIPLAEKKIAYDKTQIVYTVPLNYNPKIVPIADQNMTVSEKKQIEVKVDAGFPTEWNRFIFEKCESSTPTIVEVKCYKFLDTSGQIILNALSAGTATITLQVNDTQDENNLSEPIIFQVTIP